jgi:hypothetical protein
LRSLAPPAHGLHYSGQWFFLVVTPIAVVCFHDDNRRLRALLRQHNIDPRSARRQM